MTVYNVDYDVKPSEFDGFCDVGELLVTDVFSTLQGEGLYAGERALFIRLAGCNFGGKGVTAPGCSFCFPAGTQILMEENTQRNIESVGLGERVCSYSDSMDRFSTNTAFVMMERSVSYIVEINLTGNDPLPNKIYSTDNHKFYSESRGWIEAQSLVVGDRLLRFHGPADEAARFYVTVQSIKTLTPTTEEWSNVFGETNPLPVYNLSVENDKTYIANGLVVHNCDTDFRVSNSTKMTFESLQGLVDELHPGTMSVSGRRLIVVTGGEPLMQRNLVPFIMETTAHYPDLVWQVETNGCYMLPLPDYVELVVSPKVPDMVVGSQVGKYPARMRQDVFDRAVALKLLISADESSPYNGIPDFAFSFRDTNRPVYLSPINVYKRKHSAAGLWDHETYDAERCYDNHKYAAFLCERYGFRLSVQQHLLCGID